MNADDPRLPAGDRLDHDPDDVHTAGAERVDPGAGRDLLARAAPHLEQILTELEALPDTLVRAQLAQVVLARFRTVRDEALRTMVLTYDKPARQVSKDVGCSLSDVMMSCAAKRP